MGPGSGVCLVSGRASVTTIPAGLQANSTITITFWASDGTTKQTESVPIDIKTSCKRRY